MLTKAYRIVFWTGYLSVLLTTFIPITGTLNEIRLGPKSFQIRLDHLLHIGVYFLICMYFLAGTKMGFSLFKKSSLIKFSILILFLAIITELVQLWVPERAFSVFDMLFNFTGLATGLVIIKIIRFS